MQDFTIIELSAFCGTLIASIAMLCAAIQKSKCKVIRTPCMTCERDQKAIQTDIERGEQIIK